MKAVERLGEGELSRFPQCVDACALPFHCVQAYGEVMSGGRFRERTGWSAMQ